ncbi:hypothetical protein KKF82_04520 [Patescibacteria group bacterium]|nr:hypothetical protein [Patescibacteria group bacterium]
MTQKLEEKKKALQGLLQQKIAQLQNADNIRNQIANEVIETQGKIKMIDELMAEDKEPSKEITSEK